MPENRSDPASRLIALPVIRVRATGDDPAEPILYFASAEHLFRHSQVDASAYTYQPLDFDVGLGWPGLAKLLVSMLALIVVLVVAVVWLIIARQCKRRRVF